MVHRPRAFSQPESVDERLARHSAGLYGIFSRAEAVRMGATRGLIQRRVATNRWERVAPGVYRLSGVPRSWRQMLLVGCLSSGGDAVASHRSAAVLRSLAGVEVRTIEITVPKGGRRRRAGVVYHEVATLPKVDVTVVDAIPVTTVTRTLIDLGAVVSKDVLEEALDDALRRGLATISRLRWRLVELARRGRPGVAAIRALLDAREPGAVTPRSRLETLFVRLIRASGLPEPVRQHQIRKRGRVLATVDFAFPDHKVAIEVEGYRWHSGRAPWEHDLARRNRVTMRGWLVIHVTDRDIKQRPEGTIQTIASALAGPAAR